MFAIAKKQGLNLKAIFDKNTFNISTPTEGLGDNQIVEKIVSGNTQLFAELYERYHQKIYFYLLRMFNYRVQEAEDATTEVFIKAYQKIASFKTHLKFSSWLYRVAHNQAIDIIRKSKKTFASDILEDIKSVEFYDVTTQGEKKSLLSKAIIKLKPKYRNIVILYYLEEMNLEEVSNILKLSKSIVSLWLFRARTKLKMFIKQDKELSVLQSMTF
jgi:RNA polymerase sigma-70 factor, ECF subfamily